MINAVSVKKYIEAVKSAEVVKHTGKVIQVIGLTIEAQGPAVQLREICHIYNYKASGFIDAEVVGFRDDRILLMPLGELDGIGPGSQVVATHRPLMVPVGRSLIGRVLDGLGNPIDGKGELSVEAWLPTYKTAPHPLSRKRITKHLTLGIKAIDGLLTCGQGQRLGIFSGSGVGKSTLLGMIARNTEAEVNVIALIGERGREVRDFLERDLKDKGLAHSVIVVATSDQPALLRIKGALVATAIAEHFRDEGKNVLLMMDSLTRFAMAQREVGLAVGEPPVTRGYTPSVFAVLPKVLERAGNSEKGSITGLYTVLVDGDDFNEPISDAVRGILDGHIALSRELANSGHYPAIDVLPSVSRVMPDVVSKDHLKMATRLKTLVAAYKDARDLINIGAYHRGSNRDIDEAMDKMPEIVNFLQQDTDESVSLNQTLNCLSDFL
jgi:flagellum-specific ATP synthase